jgi:threonine aldolase
VRTIDLRSDTVTRPTPAMREAMASAELGDDVYGEDPTVNRLEAAAAARVGKEAAVFVPSGTMANQIAIRLHTHHAEVVLASHGAHVLRYEGGAASALAGVQIATIGDTGLFDADSVRAAYVPASNVHLAPTTLLVAEDTHNVAGGRVFPLEMLHGAVDAAKALGMAAHLDGARLFDAAVASRVPVARIAEPFDTVAFCFSKGLGAPVGSVLCGPETAMLRARRLRKLLGGGMRQAGGLAAAALYALEHHVERLAEDHANARHLAEGLEKLGLPVRPAPETNMVLFEVADTMGFLRAIGARALRINPTAPGRFRAVTHLDVSRADIDDAIGRVDEALAELARC